MAETPVLSYSAKYYNAKIKNNKASVGNVKSKSNKPLALRKKVVERFIKLFFF